MARNVVLLKGVAQIVFSLAVPVGWMTEQNPTDPSCWLL